MKQISSDGERVKRVVSLAEVAGEVIAVTELEPAEGQFIGKKIERDGRVVEYPKVTWWYQSVTLVPAKLSHLFAYLRAARQRNICLIRGTPADPERTRSVRRQRAGIVNGRDRGTHGFDDEPTRLLFLDFDGVIIDWRNNVERAVRGVVEQLGEPWSETSFVWFLSAIHGGVARQIAEALDRQDHRRQVAGAGLFHHRPGAHQRRSHLIDQHLQGARAATGHLDLAHRSARSTTRSPSSTTTW